MSKRPIVAMNCIGSWGRFANSIFQYVFLCIYAKRSNFEMRTPPWIGQFLFGHNESSISGLSPVHDNVTAIYDGTDSTLAFSTRGNIDMYGYFQYHTRFYLPHKDFFCSLCKPISKVQTIVEKSIDMLRSKGSTIIGLHLRRGDFETFTEPPERCFFVAPCKWYLDWLDENWNRFDKPVLFIASDGLKKVIGDFAKYNPVTNKSLGISLQEAPFYPDFYTLSQCDIMGISNSTYSFVASMLNEKCTEFYRPRLTLEKLVSYKPWDAYPSLRDNYL